MAPGYKRAREKYRPKHLPPRTNAGGGGASASSSNSAHHPAPSIPNPSRFQPSQAYLARQAQAQAASHDAAEVASRRPMPQPTHTRFPRSSPDPPTSLQDSAPQVVESPARVDTGDNAEQDEAEEGEEAFSDLEEHNNTIILGSSSDLDTDDSDRSPSPDDHTFALDSDAELDVSEDGQESLATWELGLGVGRSDVDDGQGDPVRRKRLRLSSPEEPATRTTQDITDHSSLSSSFEPATPSSVVGDSSFSAFARRGLERFSGVFSFMSPTRRATWVPNATPLPASASNEAQEPPSLPRPGLLSRVFSTSTPARPSRLSSLPTSSTPGTGISSLAYLDSFSSDASTSFAMPDPQPGDDEPIPSSRNLFPLAVDIESDTEEGEVFEREEVLLGDDYYGEEDMDMSFADMPSDLLLDDEGGDDNGEQDMDMSFTDLPSDVISDASRRGFQPISFKGLGKRPLAMDSGKDTKRLDLSSGPPHQSEGSQMLKAKLSYMPSPLGAGAPVAHLRASYTSHSAPSIDDDPFTFATKVVHERPSGSAPVAPTRTRPRPSSTTAQSSTSLHSSSSKRDSISRKLASAFPLEFPSFTDVAPSIFAPATNIATAGSKALAPPHEGAVWGFWPASPRLERGKAAYPPPPPTPDSSTDAADDESKPPVHIFIDNSNVFYGFLTFIRASFPSARLATTVLPSKGKGKREIRSLVLGGKKVRLDYATLFALLERGRKVEGRVLAGSSVLCQGLEGAVDWGYEVSLLQRVPRDVIPAPSRSTSSSSVFDLSKINISSSSSNTAANTSTRSNPAKEQARLVRQQQQHGSQTAKTLKEQGVDEILHLKILQTLLDHSPAPSNTPSTASSKSPPAPILILVTGDARSSDFSPLGFIGCVQRALDRGWNVEIYAWKTGTSGVWNGLAGSARVRGRVKVIALEQWGEELLL